MTYMEQSKNSSLATSSKMQEIFLNHCRKERIVLVVDAIDAHTYRGTVSGFDQDCIVLEEKGSQQLLFKNSVIAIRPEQDLNLIFNDAYRFRNTVERYERDQYFAQRKREYVVDPPYAGLEREKEVTGRR